MNRRNLEYFLAVAARGSFTSAAHALSVAQPSLSHAIGGLERELGVQLFHRLGRGVSLTPAGEALVAPAQQVLRAFAGARARVQEVAGLVAGRLEIVTLTTLAVNPLAMLTAEFRRQHPGIELSIVDPDSAAAVGDMVRRGQCELGITDARLVATSGLELLELPAQEVLAVLPPGTPVPPSGALTMADVAELDLISTPQGTMTRTLVDAALSLAGTPTRIAVETTHRAIIVPLVLQGAGSTLLPRPLAEDAARLGALVLPLDPSVCREGMLVWRSGSLSPAGVAFLEIVKRWLATRDAEAPTHP
jgi:LysR family transcriptional regulator, carnitine catabolism transcriptional activator